MLVDDVLEAHSLQTHPFFGLSEQKARYPCAASDFLLTIHGRPLPTTRPLNPPPGHRPGRDSLGLLRGAAMSLHVQDPLMIDPGLPSGCANPLDAMWIKEDGFDLLEGLGGGLGEHEEDVDEHGDEEDAEEDVDSPRYADEGGRDEV